MQIARATRIAYRLPCSRAFSTDNTKEAHIRALLEKEFQPTHLEVVDHSGTCTHKILQVINKTPTSIK